MGGFSAVPFIIQVGNNLLSEILCTIKESWLNVFCIYFNVIKVNGVLKFI